MNRWRVALDIEPAVPHVVEFRPVWCELQCGVDLDGGAGMDGG